MLRFMPAPNGRKKFTSPLNGESLEFRDETLNPKDQDKFCVYSLVLFIIQDFHLLSDCSGPELS